MNLTFTSPLNASPDDLKRMDDDRIWFDRNPDRQYRVRRPLPGEELEPNTNYIVVRKLLPELRMRLPVEVRPSEEVESEAGAFEMWRRAARFHPEMSEARIRAFQLEAAYKIAAKAKPQFMM